jgi:hypothetical protein
VFLKNLTGAQLVKKFHASLKPKIYCHLYKCPLLDILGQLNPLHTLNFIKDENGYLLADSRSILNRWKNNFCQLLNVHGVNDVRQTEMRKAEPLIHEPSSLEGEMKS